MTLKISGTPAPGSQNGQVESVHNTKGTTFSNIMKGVGKFALATGKAAATMIPGSTAISTFFESFGQETSMGQYGGMTPMEMLGIQQEMLQEARIYTLLSNVMRIRHDAAMNAMRNIK